ncbi:HAD-IIIC family phosphatase (plasmid) [Alkalihalophilus pseudofirmus]|uniref:HAD-IIIC family phosphatase n=1 Tax=Alkalihalophilus pseudofirmus TaxID=79885 RepID=UPI00259B60F0|nr:HAD-IIIC family phosphatase [Alkalihalophilus pseudofirmus]WEG19165.1 HAD-IIIC family phosphatase [Alkalihalophilus pseudofirmus]
MGVNKRKNIKCVVWDLDNTLWDGVLLEDENVSLRSGVKEIIHTLDERGILQSISSKNEHNRAIQKLKEFGLEEYFIYPQINWNSKSSSITEIAKSLNIGINTFAFIDDQPFEREEVEFVLPSVLCIDSTDLTDILLREELIPKFVTEDSNKRRRMYLSDIKRKTIEETFKGTQDEFLASLDMKFTISEVGDGDLQRAEELTVRTNQLNTTGYTYSYEELNHLRSSDNHILLISGLEDKYGTYGKIGLTLVEKKERVWTIKLLLMSCRVMSRGVGTVMLNHLINLAKEAGVQLQAEFKKTDKNRMMYITYKFAGFNEIQQEEDFIIFENSLDLVQKLPDYLTLEVKGEQELEQLVNE